LWMARKVGFVFQNPDHQLFSETVEEEISFALKNFGYDKKAIKERVDWALNLLDLTEYRKVSPFMLSGGERKRVALASVLAWDPKNWAGQPAERTSQTVHHAAEQAR